MQFHRKVSFLVLLTFWDNTIKQIAEFVCLVYMELHTPLLLLFFLYFYLKLDLSLFSLFPCLLQDELMQMVQSKNLTLSFSSESSIEEELKRESTADAITILVSLYSGLFVHVFVVFVCVHILVCMHLCMS